MTIARGELLIEGETPSNGALSQRRGGPGRPAGSKNRRSLDLARWIAHQFDGLTPGQQAATIALVTADDVETAREDARELGIVDLGLDPLTLAMAVKAKRLSRALGCEPFEAWALLARERNDLMRYVHQVQPAARDAGAKPPATVFLVPEGEALEESLARLPDDDGDPDFIEEFGALDAPVSQSQSHGGDEG